MWWALCVAWAASAAALDETPPQAPQPGEQVWPARIVELHWMHSIERVQWIEAYALPQPDAQFSALQPLRARVVGSGAGMEPAPQALWRHGGYEWTPPQPVPQLLLAHSAYTADYALCLDGRCTPLAERLPAQASAHGGVVRLRPCRTD
ncbi:hypothetical protein Talka_00761 [Tepidimonas alkaliphilus]|uniref:DUF1850 domain-containing protein n=1 Tax=Tepidimonas alkaliphilus TaxID=2588942 RepID=A0A554WA09_9BURK|nr:hypothetical protein Talka_00761 [Tepidimonas alkaliphilus]